MTITNQQKELVKDVVRLLHRAVDAQGSRHFVADLIREETRQERQHRNGWCSGREYPRNFGPKLAAEFLTANHIVGFIFDDVPFPSIEDVLFLKGTYVEAAAIASAFYGEIRDVVPSCKAKQLREMDYVDLVATGAADE